MMTFCPCDEQQARRITIHDAEIVLLIVDVEAQHIAVVTPPHRGRRPEAVRA